MAADSINDIVSLGRYCIFGFRLPHFVIGSMIEEAVLSPCEAGLNRNEADPARDS